MLRGNTSLPWELFGPLTKCSDTPFRDLRLRSPEEHWDFVQGYSVRHEGRRQLTNLHPSVKENIHKAAPKEEGGSVNVPNTNSVGGKDMEKSLSDIFCVFTSIKDRTFSWAWVWCCMCVSPAFGKTRPAWATWWDPSQKQTASTKEKKKKIMS